LKALGATVYPGSRERRLDRRRRHGGYGAQRPSGHLADLCLPSDGTTAERIKEATKGLGATAVLDFVGIDATLAMAVASLRARDRIVVIGIGGGTFPFTFTGVPYGTSIMTVMGGSTVELVEVVALAESGKIKPLIQRFSLDEVDTVYEKLAAGEIVGRAVVIP